jgi:hypothetical protein
MKQEQMKKFIEDVYGIKLGPKWLMLPLWPRQENTSNKDR